MERAGKSRKVVAIVMIFAVLFTLGCVTDTATNGTKENITNVSAPSPTIVVDEFNDNLDEALQELEETR